MKNTTKKKASAKKKLLPAAGSLLISAAMLSTSTYAWFTMNKEVQVTGLQMKTTVSGNLLISADNVEAHYTNDTLNQARQVLLEPTSTVKATDGSFYYTLDAAADGKKIHATSGNPYVKYNENSDSITGIDKITATDTDKFASSGAAKEKMDSAFNAAYGISGAAVDNSTAFGNAYGYVDYTFFLKATADVNNQEVRMTRCNLVRNYAEGEAAAADHVLDNTNKAWRVAVFAETVEQTKGEGVVSLAVTESTDTPKTILAPNGAVNFTSGNAVTSETALGTVTNAASDAVIGTVAKAGSTAYYKVVVRVWLEGEDTQCFSANYSLMKELYKLDLAFELGKGTAVKEIGSTLDSFTKANAGE